MLPRPRPVNVFEIHTTLPVWLLYAVHDLLLVLATLTGSTVDYVLVADSSRVTEQTP